MTDEEFVRMFVRDNTDRSWMGEAACRGMDITTFFPGQHDKKSIISARKVCERCMVSDQCAEYGLEEDHGVWGGTTGRQRRKVRSSK